MKVASSDNVLRNLSKMILGQMLFIEDDFGTNVSHCANGSSVDCKI